MSGHYRLLGQIETGELADLYAARSDSGQALAVKLFHPNTSDVRYAQALADTARKLQAVASSGLARYVEFGLLKDRLAVVREDVDGVTLGHALQRLSTREVLLQPEVALALFIEILESVQPAHDAGVVHGALTPGNVLLGADGHPVVTDFGALSALQAVPALKRVFPARGRSAYRAPEVGRGEPPTEMSDLYSLGAIGYELLTLREAQLGPPGVSTRRDAPPPPSRVDRRLNARLDPILLRALEPIPSRRYRSSGEFSSAIRNFLANNGGMPLREDIQKAIRELSAGRPALGPAPFTDFTLVEVDGAGLPPLHELSLVLQVRPGFSKSGVELALVEDAKTQEAKPAFEEYKPDPGEAVEPSQEIPTHYDTDPGLGAAEKPWEAPPGIPPPKPRRSVSLPSEPTAVGRSPRNPRLRVHEDYAAPPPVEEETDPNPQVPRKRPMMPDAPPRYLGENTPSTGVGLDDTAPQQMEGPLWPSPSPSRPALNTRELAKAWRRRQMLLGSIGLAAVGAVLLVFAVKRKGGAPREANPPSPYVVRRTDNAPRPDPALRTIGEALRKYAPHDAESDAPSHPKSAEARPSTEGTPEPAPDAPPTTTPAPQGLPAPDDVTFDDPPDRRSAGFLTLMTDMPATVTVDGFKVRGTAPLFKYPVLPGKRRIGVETVATHERQFFETVFEKGKLRRMEVYFRSTK